jgi:hypothetical protein
MPGRAWYRKRCFRRDENAKSASRIAERSNRGAGFVRWCTVVAQGGAGPHPGITIAIVVVTQGEVPMYWVFVGVFTGIGFAWVTVRRRRKTGEKTA